MLYILVIDDHPAVREGTKAILEAEEGVKVDCLAPPYTIEVLKKIDFSQYDVLLMDLNLGDVNGMDLSVEILRLSTKSKIILYTGYDVEDYFEEALQIGIYGAVSKTESKDKLLDYIRHAIEGEIVLSYDYFKKVLTQNEIHTKKKETHEYIFSDREVAILQEVEKGLTNQEIADSLHLSKRTIEYSLTAIFNKLNVSSRTEAVLIAKSKGLLD
ncbi:response regulator transcription factor [Bacillus weihaiensis]|uniref:DNA-binding response regulator n=1 Tax=Bacillus weihaiensis TaxID=1547283 RepID=A0A1L3MND6_9BACI|nr:response regulator transcription factor [Bacillus weihaiensis]APH03859.1 DNA-binding response regulator [Bacillus weihaiensis]